MRNILPIRGSRAVAGWRSLTAALLAAASALAAAQEAAPAEGVFSALPFLLVSLVTSTVVAAVCFFGAIAWARRRPAGSVAYKALLGGTALASIVLTWVVLFVSVGGMSRVMLVLVVVGNVAAAAVLSTRFRARDERKAAAAPAPVAEPRETRESRAEAAPNAPPAPPPAPASVASTRTVFISYRRIDSSDVTGRIYDRLVASHGRSHVFKDVDSIPLGTDFRRHVAALIEQSDCVLAVIGRQWLDVADGAGRRRLDDPTDLVRIEIEAALARGVPVIPLLVQGAPMPDPQMLPDALRPLAFRNGMSVRADPDFHRDLDRLDEQLRLLASAGSR